MDKFKAETIKTKVNLTIEALKANNMNAFYAETSADAVEIAKTILKDGDTISHGGSVTLKEAGFTELFGSGKYNYLDRSKATTAMASYTSVQLRFTSGKGVSMIAKYCGMHWYSKIMLLPPR